MSTNGNILYSMPKNESICRKNLVSTALEFSCLKLFCSLFLLSYIPLIILMLISFIDIFFQALAIFTLIFSISNFPIPLVLFLFTNNFISAFMSCIHINLISWVHIKYMIHKMRENTIRLSQLGLFHLTLYSVIPFSRKWSRFILCSRIKSHLCVCVWVHAIVCVCVCVSHYLYLIFLTRETWTSLSEGIVWKLTGSIFLQLTWG